MFLRADVEMTDESIAIDLMIVADDGFGYSLLEARGIYEILTPQELADRSIKQGERERMSILEKVKRGKVAKPRRICVYGSHGVGKTTWASRFPDALVIATEDGSGDIDVARLSVDSALDVLQAANEASYFRIQNNHHRLNRLV